MLDKEMYTADGEKIEQDEFYFLVISGNPVPMEVTCVMPGLVWSYVADVDDLDEDDNASFVAIDKNNFDVRNDSLFASRENAIARAEQLYKYMVDSYKEKINNLKDFIAFPLDNNLIDNPAARVAYLSKGEELTGDSILLKH